MIVLLPPSAVTLLQESATPSMVEHYFFLAGALAPLRGVAGLDFGDCLREDDADFLPFFGSGVGSGSGGALGSLFTVC